MPKIQLLIDRLLSDVEARITPSSNQALLHLRDDLHNWRSASNPHTITAESFLPGLAYLSESNYSDLAQQLFAVLSFFFCACENHRFRALDVFADTNFQFLKHKPKPLLIKVALEDFYSKPLSSLIKADPVPSGYRECLYFYTRENFGFIIDFLSARHIFEDFLWRRDQLREIPRTDPSLINNPFSDETELRNLQFLNTMTNWQDLLAENELGIITLRSSSLTRILPLGSVCLAKGLGSLICHPYLIDSIAIFPIYSGMISSVEGFFIISPGIAEPLLFFLESSPNIQILEQSSSDYLSFIIDNFISTPKASRRDTSRFSSLKKAIIVGQRNNYGHSVINESSIFQLIESASLQPLTDIILGHNDYFNTFQFIQNLPRPAVDIQSRLKLISEADFVNGETYGWSEYFVIPLTSYRPHFNSLKALGSINASPSAARPYSKCVYVSLDSRVHGRYILDKVALFRNIVACCISRNIDAIIIDGNTAVPKYSRDDDNRISLHYPEVPIASRLYDQIISLSFQHGVSCIVIDGLSFPEKVEVCSHYEIDYAIAPYGSSMMFPIYILNCPLGIIGSEIFANYLQTWRWHITRYCHSERHIKEFYIDSSITAGNGYIVSPASIESFFEFASLLP